MSAGQLLVLRTPDAARIAYDAVTTTTAATAVAINTTSCEHRILLVSSNLNVPVMVTYDGIDLVVLPASTSVAIDLASAGLVTASGIIIGVYHLGTAPTTSGFINVTLL